MDGYDDETDKSDAAEDAIKKQDWRTSLRRKEGFSARKKREEKQRSDKYAQKGELNSRSNRSGMAETRRAYAGENADENAGANASAYADENTDENASANAGANAGENATANPSANADENADENAAENASAYASENASAYAAANASENAAENASAYASENASAYTAANASENPTENASAYASVYTDDEMDVYIRPTDPEELQVDTVRRRLYTRRGERDEIDPLNLEDHSSRTMTRSHSGLMTRPTTLEMNERHAARNGLNGLSTRRNGLSKFRGPRTMDLPMSTWMTPFTTATMVTTANSRPRMSTTVDHDHGRRKEGRMNEPIPRSKMFGTREKEVRGRSRRKDDDCRGSNRLEPTRERETSFLWEEDRCTLDDQIEYSVRQAVLQCHREDEEEEERRRRRAYEEVEDIRRSFEQEMEQHNRASTEALARADRMLVKQAESMEQRVKELTRRMQREHQMLEDQLKEEREENRRQGMMHINPPVPATDEYTYIRSLHQPRSRALQLEQPERDVARRGEGESTRMNSDVRNIRHLVEDVDVSSRCAMERKREEELTD
jgi:hypothetical protein